TQYHQGVCRQACITLQPTASILLLIQSFQPHFFAIASPIIVVQPTYVNKCFTKRKEVSFFYGVGDGKLLPCCVTLECTSSQLALELVSVLPCVVVRVLWKPPQIL